ncbi:MAG: bifunctional cobalt-precorrin-7 (C(5))-methyltransferase/cobalt-precorrin-6B (C(15))-methyltransferase [Acetobacteraceae bacterium]
MSTTWLRIVGIGEDGVEGLSARARALVGQASLVVGGRRHLALAETLISGEVLAWPSPIGAAYADIVARRGTPVVVLASGDPNCFGIGTALHALVPPDEIECLPAPSALSLAAARLGWALQEVGTLSFCGRPLAAVLPRLQPGARLLALSADAATPGALAALLVRAGFGPSRLHVLEALGGPCERIRSCTADAGPPGDIGALNLVAIEVEAAAGARIIPLAAGLPDDAFEHDGQITKREVRAVTLSALAPRQGELLWDIGCGAGSVAIEWVLRHPANRAIGIESRPDRAARSERNAEALGAIGLAVVVGRAPEALAGLPPPDAVFIGGGAQDPGLLDAAWKALRPGGRIVANAIAIDTEALLFDAQSRRGGTLTRIAVDRMDVVGRMRAFRPSMPVTQWAAEKP